MNRTLWSEYWELLNTAEDYLDRGGFRRKHSPAPVIRPGAGQTEAKESGAEKLLSLHKQIGSCVKCALGRSRQEAVTGAGTAGCSLIIIGDRPAARDEQEGLPFAGKPGAYLDKWLAAINLERQVNCYLCNLVKCRPPGDREPGSDEVRTCFPWLEAQVQLLEPAAILCLGSLAARVLTGQLDTGLDALRGQVHSFSRVPLVATYHPRDVLADASLRGVVWEDLKLLRTCLEE